MTHHAQGSQDSHGDGDFRGAKLILLLGPHLLVIRRDLRGDIPWPGFLDFPGGGREGRETAVDCALRETREEIGLDVAPERIAWRHASHREDGLNWFFAAKLGVGRAQDVALGDEGTGWALMAPEDYLERDDAIPHFRDILRLYLTS